MKTTYSKKLQDVATQPTKYKQTKKKPTTFLKLILRLKKQQAKVRVQPRTFAVSDVFVIS